MFTIFCLLPPTGWWLWMNSFYGSCILFHKQTPGQVGAPHWNTGRKQEETWRGGWRAGCCSWQRGGQDAGADREAGDFEDKRAGVGWAGRRHRANGLDLSGEKVFRRMTPSQSCDPLDQLSLVLTCLNVFHKDSGHFDICLPIFLTFFPFWTQPLIVQQQKNDHFVRWNPLFFCLCLSFDRTPSSVMYYGILVTCSTPVLPLQSLVWTCRVRWTLWEEEEIRIMISPLSLCDSLTWVSCRLCVVDMCCCYSVYFYFIFFTCSHLMINCSL